VAKIATQARQTPTLRDVAAAAGVHLSTVSKVLGDGGITVRPETRQRILDAARELRYRPNASARGLRLKRTGAFGMLLPDFTNPVYATIVRGAVRRAEELGYVMLLAEIRGDAPDAYRHLVLENRIDGLIVATARASSSLARELRNENVPHVFANRRVRGAHRSVTVDDEAGAAVAAGALFEHGHRRIGLIAGPRDTDTARRRAAGFVRACDRLGIVPRVSAEQPYTREGGYLAMTSLLESGERPTGVFASNLLAGVGALTALHAHRLAVPGDISLVTFDDESAEFTHPPLTAVRLPFGEMGARAVEELQRVLAGEKPSDVVVETPPTLVKRSSLAAPPAS
jgi:DNA-binding LacI/PurR family transcriptional regulator